MVVCKTTKVKHFGRSLVGKVLSGEIREGDKIYVRNQSGIKGEVKVGKISKWQGLSMETIAVGGAGDILILSLIGDLQPCIGDTLASHKDVQHISSTIIDEPLLHMQLKSAGNTTVNELAVQLAKEAAEDVALRVCTETLKIHGRGEMHLGVVLSNIRAKGLQFLVSAPQVVFKRDSKKERLEPIEYLDLEQDAEFDVAVTQLLSNRMCDLVETLKISSTLGDKIRVT